jgi:hypothetical protein
MTRHSHKCLPFHDVIRTRPCRKSAFSRQFPTVATRVPSQVSWCSICGGQCGNGSCFLRVLLFPLPIVRHSSASIIRGRYSWSEFLATEPEVRVRFSALSNCLRSSGSGTGPLSLVSTTEELLGRKTSDFGLQDREYDRRNPLRWPRGTLYPQKLALTSPTRGGGSVGIVRSRTQTTEFSFSGRRTK